MIKITHEGSTIEQEAGGICFIANLGIEVMKNLESNIVEIDSSEGIVEVLRAENLKKEMNLKKVIELIRKV